MIRAAFIFACLFALAAFGGFATRQQSAPATSPSAKSTGVRFQAVEIWLDSGNEPLAAYQIEFKPADADRDRVKIVGIEGGLSDSVFAAPPYYDPAAMQQEHVIIAAYSTANAEALPTGRTRVATIHMQVSGAMMPQFRVRTMAAATINGREIPADAIATPAK